MASFRHADFDAVRRVVSPPGKRPAGKARGAQQRRAPAEAHISAPDTDVHADAHTHIMHAGACVYVVVHACPLSSYSPHTASGAGPGAWGAGAWLVLMGTATQTALGGGGFPELRQWPLPSAEASGA